VKEVNPAEGTSDTRIDGMLSTLKLNLGLTPNMWKYITLSQLDKSKLNIIAVSGII
jgi:hypothetical protein